MEWDVGSSKFLLCVLGKNEGQRPVVDTGLTAAGHEERRPPASVLRPFSLVVTVLSMTILTYMDLRFNSKTLPIYCQSTAK